MLRQQISEASTLGCASFFGRNCAFGSPSLQSQELLYASSSFDSWVGLGAAHVDWQYFLEAG